MVVWKESGEGVVWLSWYLVFSTWIRIFLLQFRPNQTVYKYPLWVFYFFIFFLFFLRNDFFMMWGQVPKFFQINFKWSKIFKLLEPKASSKKKKNLLEPNVLVPMCTCFENCMISRFLYINTPSILNRRNT